MINGANNADDYWCVCLRQFIILLWLPTSTINRALSFTSLLKATLLLKEHISNYFVMFYVLNSSQLWTLPTASCLALINYWRFNQNLEPNVVIYEHTTVPKCLGSAPKFGECSLQNQIPVRLRDPRIPPWVLWGCQFHLCWWMESNLTTGKQQLYLPSHQGVPSSSPTPSPKAHGATQSTLWGKMAFLNTRHENIVLKWLNKWKIICWDKYISFCF